MEVIDVRTRSGSRSRGAKRRTSRSCAGRRRFWEAWPTTATTGRFPIQTDNGQLASWRDWRAARLHRSSGSRNSRETARSTVPRRFFTGVASTGVYRKLHPAIRHSVYAAACETPAFQVWSFIPPTTVCRTSAPRSNPPRVREATPLCAELMVAEISRSSKGPRQSSRTAPYSPGAYAPRESPPADRRGRSPDGAVCETQTSGPGAARPSYP